MCNGQFFLYFYDDTPAVSMKKLFIFMITDDDADNVRGEYEQFRFFSSVQMGARYQSMNARIKSLFSYAHTRTYTSSNRMMIDEQ